MMVVDFPSTCFFKFTLCTEVHSKFLNVQCLSLHQNHTRSCCGVRQVNWNGCLRIFSGTMAREMCKDGCSCWRGLIFVGNHFHKNLTPWKCYPWIICPQKFSHLQYCYRCTCTLYVIPIVEWHLSHLCRLWTLTSKGIGFVHKLFTPMLLHYSSVWVGGLLYTLKGDSNEHKWHLTWFVTCSWWPAVPPDSILLIIHVYE